MIEFWVPVDTEDLVERYFQIFGTGSEIPPEYVYVGTAPRDGLGNVWHLFVRSQI